MTDADKRRRLYQRLGIVSFRIYPGVNRSGLYATVQVFRTAAEMRRAVNVEARGATQQRLPDDSQGSVQSHKRISFRNGVRRTLGEFCVVNFHRSRLGVEVITHEFGHAAFAWADRKNVWGPLSQSRGIGTVATMPLEERYCYALGRMVRGFVERANELGLYGED